MSSRDSRGATPRYHKVEEKDATWSIQSPHGDATKATLSEDSELRANGARLGDGLVPDAVNPTLCGTIGRTKREEHPSQDCLCDSSTTVEERASHHPSPDTERSESVQGRNSEMQCWDTSSSCGRPEEEDLISSVLDHPNWRNRRNETPRPVTQRGALPFERPNYSWAVQRLQDLNIHFMELVETLRRENASLKHENEDVWAGNRALCRALSKLEQEVESLRSGTSLETVLAPRDDWQRHDLSPVIEADEQVADEEPA